MTHGEIIGGTGLALLVGAAVCAVLGLRVAIRDGVPSRPSARFGYRPVRRWLVTSFGFVALSGLLVLADITGFAGL